MKFITALVVLIVITLFTTDKNESKKLWTRIALLVIGYLVIQVLLSGLL